MASALAGGRSRRSGDRRHERHRFRLTDDCLSGSRIAADIPGGASADSFLDSQRAVLRRALAAANGNATQAAKTLGIGRATLYRRMDKAGLSRR